MLAKSRLRILLLFLLVASLEISQGIDIRKREGEPFDLNCSSFGAQDQASWLFCKWTNSHRKQSCYIRAEESELVECKDLRDEQDSQRMVKYYSCFFLAPKKVHFSTDFFVGLCLENRLSNLYVEVFKSQP